LHQQKNIKQDLLICKKLFTQNGNVYGLAFFKVYWSQNIVRYSWKFEIFFALFIWKTIWKRPALLPEFLLIFILHAFHFL